MELEKKRLMKAFEASIEPLSKKFRQFPWEDPAVYAIWLAQSYYLVRHTTTFLCLVAAKLGPAHPELHRAVLKHLREEVGHDQLAVKDLLALKKDVTEFPELNETALICQSQYYWIEHGGPFAHAGYSLMLEGLAMRECKPVMERLERAYGKSAATFVRVHAMEDDGHFEEGLNRMLAAPESDKALAMKNLAQSQMLYEGMLAACQARARGSRAKAG